MYVLNKELFYQHVVMWRWCVWLMALSCLTSCDSSASKAPATVPPSTAVPVRIVRHGSGYQLERGGQPYFIRGGGGVAHFRELRKAGGNSVRLWTTDYAQPLLDSAQANGLTVLLGLWLVPERDGFDYYDRDAMARQLQALRAEVLRYRNHPALLAWDVGNELELGANNPEVYTAINQVAEMIHELDPHHPVLTTIATPAVAKLLAQRCPALDLIGINSYAGLLTLPQNLRSTDGQMRPYIVTEFGPKGFWEAPLTTWKAPVEQTSSVKAEFAAERYRKALVADSQYCLGGYVFYWGQRQEATPTWFSLFTVAGERTNLVDEMQRLWTGAYPLNRCPQIGALQLNSHFDSEHITLQAGQEYKAILTVMDLEGDSVRVQWEVRPDPDWKAEKPAITASHEPLPNAIRQQGRRHATVRAPRTAGPYRLYATVTDGHGGAATANAPFYVSASRR